jgi:hypothetical protein
MTDRTLTLKSDGPDPEDLSAKNGDAISIVNKLGESVVMTLSNPSVFNPSHGTELTVSTTGWDGHIGNASSDYSYPVGDAELAPRNGRISVGN